MSVLTGDLRDRLSRDGWIQIPRAVDPARSRMAAEWITESSKDARRLVLLQTERDPTGQLRKFRRIYWADPAFWSRWIVESGMRDVARAVIGPAVCLLKQAAFLKARQDGSAVGFHQDQALWETKIPGAYSFWTPLDPADGDNGGLIMFTGSHRKGILPHEADREHPWHGVVDVDAHGLEADQVVIEPGGLVVHNPYLVHGSRPNLSPRPRRAVVFTFAPEPDDETRPNLRERYISLSEIEELAAEGAAARPA